MSGRLPGWQKSEEALRSQALRISAGRSLLPEAWPGGARMAVLFSFDVDTETWELMDADTPPLSDLSRGEYGARVGLKRVLDLLDAHGIPASFFVPAMSARTHPGLIESIQSRGEHEVGVHGFVHEHPAWLEPEEEAELLERSIEVLTRESGARPVGYRAPAYDPQPHTFELLRELEFLYDSSLMADDGPYEILANGEPTGLVELPVEWIRDDATHLDPRGDNYASPRDWLRVLLDEIEGACEEGAVFSVTMHPRTIGHRSRIVLLRELLEHIQDKGGAWFATHRQAAELAREAGRIG